MVKTAYLCVHTLGMGLVSVLVINYLFLLLIVLKCSCKRMCLFYDSKRSIEILQVFFSRKQVCS